jgi:hypothetical protein
VSQTLRDVRKEHSVNAYSSREIEFKESGRASDNL